MPEFNSKGEQLISVVRVLEYHGTVEWVTKVVQASRLPMQGEFRGHDPAKPLAEGCFIRSGLVYWDIDNQEPAPSRPVIPLPPGSTSIQ